MGFRFCFFREPIPPFPHTQQHNRPGGGDDRPNRNRKAPTKALGQKGDTPCRGSRADVGGTVQKPRNRRNATVTGKMLWNVTNQHEVDTVHGGVHNRHQRNRNQRGAFQESQ